MLTEQTETGISVTMNFNAPERETRLIVKIVFLALCLFLQPVFAQNDNGKKIKFSWERVEWAQGYEIQIKDKKDKLVFKKRVYENRIEFTLPPGKYKIRIGAIDKFDKTAAWSNWQDTKIMLKEPEGKRSLLFGIKISSGMQYVYFPNTWESPFNNSYKGISGRISFVLGEFVLFKPLKFIKYTGLLKHFGFEIEGSYFRFKGKDLPGKYKTDMTNQTAGINILYITDFDMPLNFIIRGGAGASKSMFTRYLGLNLQDKSDSFDPYYKVGGAMELSFLKYLFLECGADFFITDYIDHNLKSLRYYAQMGIRI